MPDGVAADLPPALETPWQTPDVLPDSIRAAADLRKVAITAEHWSALSELDRYALCKLVRPGHDHHNLQAAFSEVLG